MVLKPKTKKNLQGGGGKQNNTFLNLETVDSNDITEGVRLTLTSASQSRV